MKKKAYITPGTTVMTEEPESLMLVVSAGNDNIKSDDTPDDSGDDNRSRQLNVWDDGTGEGW